METKDVLIKKKKVFLRKAVDFLTLLPWEVSSLVLRSLDLKALISMSAVCKSWYALSRSNDLWRSRLKEMKWSVQMPRELTYSTDQLDWHYIYKQRHQLERRWTRGQVDAQYLLGHQDSVYCLQFDDNHIITGSRDRTIKIWSMATYKCIRTLRGHEGSVLCLQYDQYKIVSGSSDKTIIIWSMETNKIIKRLTVCKIILPFREIVLTLHKSFRDTLQVCWM